MEAEPLNHRRDVRVTGCLGYSMLINERFTMEEVWERTEAGVGTPLDLMPNEFWWAGNVPRFGEEMLGDDF